MKRYQSFLASFKRAAHQLLTFMRNPVGGCEALSWLAILGLLLWVLYAAYTGRLGPINKWLGIGGLVCYTGDRTASVIASQWGLPQGLGIGHDLVRGMGVAQ